MKLLSFHSQGLVGESGSVDVLRQIRWKLYCVNILNIIIDTLLPGSKWHIILAKQIFVWVKPCMPGRQDSGTVQTFFDCLNSYQLPSSFSIGAPCTLSQRLKTFFFWRGGGLENLLNDMSAGIWLCACMYMCSTLHIGFPWGMLQTSAEERALSLGIWSKMDSVREVGNFNINWTPVCSIKPIHYLSACLVVTCGKRTTHGYLVHGLGPAAYGSCLRNPKLYYPYKYCFKQCNNKIK